MHTVGIIAEYNPFHTGHKYHIQKAKQITGADFVIVVMSPDFVQRGTPAVFDKYSRTKMALQSGADLVLELPVCYASGSAEYFAAGAVGLFNALGVTDDLCFGCESADKNLFQLTAELLNCEPDLFRIQLQKKLRDGMTFPQARAESLVEFVCSEDFAALFPSCQTDCKDRRFFTETLPAFLASPNNILGIEYCRALGRLSSSIRPAPLTRVGNDYNSTSFGEQFSSATAVRNAIFHEDLPGCLNYIPEENHTLFCRAYAAAVSPDDLLPGLTQKLLTEADYSYIADISHDLADRIQKLRYQCIGKSYSDLIGLLKTRQMTESRIRRALLHLLLGLRQTDADRFRGTGSVFYARLLGFRKNAGPLLHEIKLKSRIPMLSRTANAQAMLDKFYREDPDRLSSAQTMLRQDIAASHLYQSMICCRYHVPFVTEYEKSPIIID